jgi:hypothetical protein
MQEFLLKGRPKKNAQNSFGIGTHRLVWPNENDLNGMSLALHDFHDDNTKMMWTHFLKQISEALASLKEFQAMVETSSGKKIKSIWSDNGDEFNAC